MSFLNKFVEYSVEQPSQSIINQYGYVVGESNDVYKITCNDQYVFLDKNDNLTTIKEVEYQPKLDNYISHEALHTTSIVMDLISHSLLEHWYAISDPEFYKLVEEAQSKLFDAYQLVGNKSL